MTIEDLLIDFDEMGFAPTTFCENPNEYACEWKRQLVAEIEKLKQVQTDTINTIVKYCENPNHWRELKDCKLFGGKSDDLRDFINKIFKEIEE